MPHSRTQHDPEQRSRATAVESQPCDDHGPRLDDARAEFRAEWQTKIEQKRQQAERAWQIQLRSWNVRNYLYRVTLAMFFFVWLAGSIGVLTSLPSICLLVGALVIGALGFGSSCSEWFWRKHAERLEREVRELERS